MLHTGHPLSVAPVKAILERSNVACNVSRRAQDKRRCNMQSAYVDLQALISPTDKNVRDALQGGVDAAELSPVLSPDIRCSFPTMPVAWRVPDLSLPHSTACRFAVLACRPLLSNLLSGMHASDPMSLKIAILEADFPVM